MDMCVKQNTLTTEKHCSAVTYSHIDPAKAAFGNCFTKSARGLVSEEDASADDGVTASAYLE